MWAQVLAGSIDILCLSLTVVLCDARTSFPNARPRSLTADAKARTNKQADRGSSGRASARCTVFPGAVGDTRRRRRSMRKGRRRRRRRRRTGRLSPSEKPSTAKRGKEGLGPSSAAARAHTFRHYLGCPERHRLQGQGRVAPHLLRDNGRVCDGDVGALPDDQRGGVHAASERATSYPMVHAVGSFRRPLWQRAHLAHPPLERKLRLAHGVLVLLACQVEVVVFKGRSVALRQHDVGAGAGGAHQ
ncbi:unnamed protein product [Prorocentrum cordatum]|uniref:Secreted protein n=1 Tax=Prorocentrum cordatum TaxID=2364126 RepID=A0ABN9UE73_9DINO|nr:unnamed protein product [Polarella glacialis]